MVKIIDELVKRNIVLYSPNIQKIGIAKIIDKKAGVKLKFLNKINSSSLSINANQVQIIHKETSVIIATNRFVYRLSEITDWENSLSINFIILIFYHNFLKITINVDISKHAKSMYISDYELFIKNYF